MKQEQIKLNKGEVVIYKSASGPEIQVKLEKESVWLDAHLIAKIFDVNRPAIVKHINNIYKSRELDEETTCSILEQVAADRKIRKMNLYNLDMIISVGYRVNSKKATEFRIWATKILKNYIAKGYAVNEKRLMEAREKFQELQTAVSFLQRQSRKELLVGQSAEILNLLADYSKTLSLLEQYDQGKLSVSKGQKTAFVLRYEDCLRVIVELKNELSRKKEASDLFGNERDKSFAGIASGLYQTFDKKELYPTIEDKASHLLYFTIKDHPFSDGNKRTASFLFVYFLDRANYLFKKSGERKINDNALTALAILIAESDPKDKEIMIKIIKNLLAEV